MGSLKRDASGKEHHWFHQILNFAVMKLPKRKAVKPLPNQTEFNFDAAEKPRKKKAKKKEDT